MRKGVSKLLRTEEGQHAAGPEYLRYDTEGKEKSKFAKLVSHPGKARFSKASSRQRPQTTPYVMVVHRKGKSTRFALKMPIKFKNRDWKGSVQVFGKKDMQHIGLGEAFWVNTKENQMLSPWAPGSYQKEKQHSDSPDVSHKAGLAVLSQLHKTAQQCKIWLSAVAITPNTNRFSEQMQELLQESFWGYMTSLFPLTRQ